MNRSIKRALVVAAIATSALVGTAATGSASSAAKHPVSHIEGTGKNLKYVPNKVTAPIAPGTCTTTNFSFTVVNSTSATEQVTYKGAAFGKPIPPKGTLFVCGSGEINGSLSIKADPKAKLTFVIT